MTKKEKQILEFFLHNRSRLITKKELVHEVWWCGTHDITDNTLNVTISKV